tara:strand:- start:574 stop:1407 length:834 start_codon:yes stop_codon:yes gene_type:complete
MNNLIEKIIWILTINFMLNACSSVAKDPPKPKNSLINKLDSLLTISEPEAKAIGKRIWINECGGTIEGLTSWNKGEYFASLGIGHFIWYHRIKRGPYEESFPSLVRYLVSKGVNVPEFILNKQCPWETRDDFVKARNSPQMIELRNLLLSTIPLQTEFILLRLENALPKMLSAISMKNRSTVQANFYKLTRTAKGKYALMDYINFKGEGTKISERYNGQGWGMLQALEEMNPNTETRNAPNEFAQAAEKVLIRRVRNAPRDESIWLKGWQNRLKTYH